MGLPVRMNHGRVVKIFQRKLEVRIRMENVDCDGWKMLKKDLR